MFDFLLVCYMHAALELFYWTQALSSKKIHLLFILFKMQTHFSVKLRAKMHSTVSPNKKN